MSRMLTPEEVAAALGIKPSTARDWMRTGKLPGTQKIGPGGLLRIDERTFDEWLKNAPMVRPKQGNISDSG